MRNMSPLEEDPQFDGMPSVTTVLRWANIMPQYPDTPQAEWARQWGSYIHTCCSLIAQKKDIESIDAEAIPYIEGFSRWLSEHLSQGYGVRHAEHDIRHWGLQYTGRIDLVLARFYPLIVEIKTGKPHPYHRIQTAAYAMGLLGADRVCNDLFLVKRGALYLSRNPEEVKFREHKDREDFQVWLSALTIAQWKHKKHFQDGLPEGEL